MTWPLMWLSPLWVLGTDGKYYHRLVDDVIPGYKNKWGRIR